MIALRAYPEGGAGLEAAILAILQQESRRQPAPAVAHETLAAAAYANEAQLTAIGRALAEWTLALAESDFTGARGIAAAVATTRDPGLKRAYSATLGRRVFEHPEIPAGTDGGGLTSPSPS